MRAAETAALILTRTDIKGLMDGAAWLEAVETGFRAAATRRASSPPPMKLEAVGGAFHAKGATLKLDRHYVALKLNGNFPANPWARGLPTIQGAILLCDGEDGRLLAILDSIEVTLRRTAAATTLAARYLARPEAETILICGCGAQGLAQLEALREVLPLRRAFAWDVDEERSRTFASGLNGEDLVVEVAADLSRAALASDVIVTCTTARTPFLRASMVKPGTFIAAVGADSDDKSEVEPQLMAEALIFTDVTDQCAVMGDLHHAIAAGLMSPADIKGELAELVSGAVAGRGSAEEITIFDSTGTALQDVASAAMIFERAVEAGAFMKVAIAA